MERQEPVITKEPTASGWETTLDFGKQGVSRAAVHVAPGTAEEAERNRAALNRVLARHGYRLTT